MKFTRGYKTNTGPIDQEVGSWLGARNIVFSKLYGAVTNEEGFDIIIEMDGDVIGHIVLDTDEVAVFQLKEDNSEIYVVDTSNNSRRLITSNTEFRFNTSCPITGEYYRNSKGEIVIVWTDDHVTPRIMNIEIDYGTSLDKLTRVFLLYDTPQLDSYSVLDTGGSLASGAYYVAFRYESIDQALTPYSLALGPFYVTPSQRSELLTNYYGAPAGTVTSKSLQLSLANIDVDYAYIEIALITQIAGVKTAKLVKKIPITASSLNTTIEGGENLGVIGMEEILSTPDIFDRVKAMTQIKNQLFMANLSKEEETTFQLQALDIVVNWGSTPVDIVSNDIINPRLVPTRGFMHNEVYMLNIHYVKNNGTVTKGFHIPGRAMQLYDNIDHPDLSGRPENYSLATFSGAQYDRARAIGGTSAKIFHFFNTADNASSASNMQYHENLSTYPNDASFGALQGQPIRHHKFPSIAHIANTITDGDIYYGRSRLDRLYIELSNVVLPAGYVGYYITSGKRDFNNSTILAQDMMLYAGRRAKFASPTNQLYWTSSGNWINIDHKQSDENLQTEPSRIRMHAFDLMLDRPGVAPNYIEGELILCNVNVTEKYNFSSKVGCSVMQSGGDNDGDEINTLDGLTLSTDQKRQDDIRLDYVTNSVSVQVVGSTVRFSKIVGFRYLPANVQDLGIYMNLNAEECAVAEVIDTVFQYNGLILNAYNSNTGRNIPQFNGGVGTFGVPEERTYLYNIKQYKDDIFADLFNTNLFLVNNQMIVPGEFDTIEGGDCIVSDYSFYTYGPRSSGDSNVNSGVRVARRHIVESVNFASYRHQVPGNGSTVFYPLTDVKFLLELVKSTSYNQFAYNKDYTSVNDINFLKVKDPIADRNLDTDFPYRIIRSRISQVEEPGVNNWRSFPVNDYYEMPKNRGEIFNIQGVGDDLIINQKYCLFRTRNKIKLATSASEVIAGSGDLFELPPQEIVPSKEGFGGCQHQLSCLLTKVGYVFVDSQQGKVFLLEHEGDLKEISMKGNEQFFFNNLQGVNDNPYTNTGFTVGYDLVYNRIILTKNNQYTFSYSLDVDNGAWVAMHDYSPNMMFNTRTGLFSFKDNIIYKHNSETSKAKYYGDTIYPSYIIPSFNDPKSIIKYFSDIRWKLEIRKLDSSLQRDETLTQLFIWDSFQATNVIDLARFLYPSINGFNTRKTAGLWRYNKFRDLVIDNTAPFVLNEAPVTSNLNSSKPLQMKRRFIDNYLLVKFIYDNQPVGGEQRNLYLYEADVEFKPVER